VVGRKENGRVSEEEVVDFYVGFPSAIRM